jgi:glycosyltransferase involved in cell wall biosynthesis
MILSKPNNKMNLSPLVSICIPTYNRAGFLKQAIQSCLSQDYANIEILISNNCSTDNTNYILTEYSDNPKIKINTNKSNIGMVANWNKLLYEMVKGEWFIILSDDDYFVDVSYISKAVNLIKSNQEVNLVYSNGYILYADNQKMIKLDIPYATYEDGVNIFLNKFTVKPQEFTLCNILFRTELAKRYKAFTDINDLSCDSELFYKICVSGKIGVIHDYVSVYLIHSSNLINMPKSYEEIIAFSNRYIEPYRLVLSHGTISDDNLTKWKRSVFRPAIKKILLHISISDSNQLSKAIRYFNSLNLTSIYSLFYDPIFTMKIIITMNKTLYKLTNQLRNIFR